MLTNSWVSSLVIHNLTAGCSRIIFTGRNKVVAKVMFLQVCVCPQGGGEGVCLSACWDAIPPWIRQTPLPQPPLGPGRPRPTRQTPPGTRQTPLPRTRQTPPGPGRHPPQDQADPPWEADSSIRSTSGRYASYWNAFLLYKCVRDQSKSKSETFLISWLITEIRIELIAFF